MEAHARRHLYCHPRQQRAQLFPAPLHAREITRRLGQRKEQHDGVRQRDRATGKEQRTPAEYGQDLRGEQARQHAAERIANDGGGHGQRAQPLRRVLGRHRRCARQRRADAESGKETDQRDPLHIVREADQHRRAAEQEHAADQQQPAADAVGNIAGDHAADGHAEQAGGHRDRKGFARHAPVPDDGRYREADQLAVEAVKDHCQRSQHVHEFLDRRKAAVDCLPDVVQTGGCCSC